MEKKRISEKMEKEGEKIAQFFSNISEWQMEIILYRTDDQDWCVRDILSHFITSERSFLKLFENIKQGGYGTPDTFSIDEFNNSQILKLRGMDTNNLIQLFIETRKETQEWINTVSDEELSLKGNHPSMGEVTLGDMVKMINLHNQMHLRDVKNSLDTN